MPNPQDPCLEQRNALDAAIVELEAALILVQERTEALIACEEQHQGLMASKQDSGCECGKVAEIVHAVCAGVLSITRILKADE